MAQTGRVDIPGRFRDPLESAAPVHARLRRTRTRQKHRNPGRDPRIAFSVVDPENPCRYPEMRGQVACVEEGPVRESINAKTTKNLGQEGYPFHRPGDERLAVYVRPHHATPMGV